MKKRIALKVYHNLMDEPPTPGIHYHYNQVVNSAKRYRKIRKKAFTKYIPEIFKELKSNMEEFHNFVNSNLGPSLTPPVQSQQ